MSQPEIERLQRESAAWQEMAEALAEIARGRAVGFLPGSTIRRLIAAKEGLRALGIEPPEEPENPEAW